MAKLKALEITKGIPVQERGGIRANGQRWPFAEMKIGDSFFADALLAGPLSNRLRSNAANWKHRHPDFHYVTRKVDGGYRLWRVAVPKGDAK